jgi:hypothetical protein
MNALLSLSLAVPLALAPALPLPDDPLVTTTAIKSGETETIYSEDGAACRAIRDGGWATMTVTIHCALPPAKCACIHDQAQGDFGYAAYTAPCRRWSKTGHLLCDDPSDPSCLTISDRIYGCADGNCDPSEPCVLAMVFTATYVEICDDTTWLCTKPKCCEWSLWLSDAGGSIGVVTKDESLDTEATANCACSTGSDNACLLQVTVECNWGGGFYQVALFGRAFQCKKCE